MSPPGRVARRVAVVLGVANSRSIAWSCVQSLLKKNLDVIFTYQNERFETTATKLIREQTKGASYPRQLLVGLPCDVSKDRELPLLFHERIPEVLVERGGGKEEARLDAVVHSIAYASAASMKQGSLLQTTKGDFSLAHEISAYSFLETAQSARDLLSRADSPPSLTALTYLGSLRAVANYNVMGPAKASLEALVRGLSLELGSLPVRVNAVSAGPVSTMAARGIANFGSIKSDVEERSPLQRNITLKEVGDTVAYVAMDASGVTGQTFYVDAGYSIVAGPQTDRG